MSITSLSLSFPELDICKQWNIQNPGSYYFLNPLYYSTAAFYSVSGVGICLAVRVHRPLCCYLIEARLSNRHKPNICTYIKTTLSSTLFYIRMNMNKINLFSKHFFFFQFKLNKTNRANVEPTIFKNNDIKMQMAFNH